MVPPERSPADPVASRDSAETESRDPGVLLPATGDDLPADAAAGGLRLVAAKAAAATNALDYNIAVLRPLFRFIRQERGEPALTQVLREAGLSAAVIENASAWISHSQFESVVAGGRALVESDEAFKRACAYQLTKFYGPVLLALRAMTVRLAFEAMARTSHLVCRDAGFSVIAGTRTSVRLRYVSSKPESRLMCMSRQGQHRAVPTMWWGIPPAKLEEHSCIAHGDGACEYTIRWYEPLRWRSALAGALLGAVGAAFVPETAMTAAFAYSLLPAIGLGGGLVTELRRMVRDYRRFSESTSREVESAVETHSKALDEVLALHQREREWNARLESMIAERTTRMDRVIERLELSRETDRARLRCLSHDISNPLTVLSTTVGFMRSSRYDRSPEDEESMRALDSAARQVSRLVDELVTILGDESGAPAMTAETVAVERLADGMRRQLRATVLGRDIRVTVFKTREAPVEIYTFPLVLERIVDNLLMNATKYTERGSIIVEVGGTPGYLLLKISDSGRGIGPERLEEVFLHGGTDANPVVGSSHGVGLATVVRLLDQLGGRLEIMSTPGVGTTLWVYVPRSVFKAPKQRGSPGESSANQFARVVKIRPRH